MKTRFDAIIMGAGPAGSTAAILLARAGWSVVLVEKQAFPRRKVCGECIAASNLKLLDALGIGDEFAACAGPDLHRVALMQGHSTIITDLPSFDHPHHAWGRALGRETLDTLLLTQARAAGAFVLQPWSVRSLEGTDGAFRCAVRPVGSHDETLLHAPVAIDARGSRELQPRSPQTPRPSRRPGDLFAFKANFIDVTLALGLLPVLSFEGGYGGMVLADRDIATLACCVRADRLEVLRRAAPGVSAGEVIDAMLRRECVGVDQALRTARRVGTWAAFGPLKPGIHLRQDDDVLRIGNAAGEAHPIIGEGLSMAIQSAWLLCAHLLRARPQFDARSQRPWQRAVRDLYAEDWRQHFTWRLRLAALLAHAAMRPRFLAPALPVLKAWTTLLGRAAQWAGKVRCAPDPATIAWLASGAGQDPQPWLPSAHRDLTPLTLEGQHADEYHTRST